MLKKQNRLTVVTKRKEDKFFSSPLFNIRISDNNEKQVKFAFIVSKAVDKRAVVRNKIKRKLRIAAQIVLGSIVEGKSIKVIVKSNILNNSEEDFLKNLEELFKKAKIIK